MYKKTITYTDYNGDQKTEDFYFNVTKAELMEMEMEKDGGMAEYLTTLVESTNPKEIIAVIKDLIRRSIGKKSEDGRRFIKNQEIVDDFMQTEAYSELFMEFASDAEEAARFVNGIVPNEVAAAAKKKSEEDKRTPVKLEDMLPASPTGPGN